MRESRTLVISLFGFLLLALVIVMQATAAPANSVAELSAPTTTVNVGAIKDNTLYEDSAGSLSNGAGQHFFAGRTGATDEGNARRGLIAFDVASSLPAGVIVVSATLTLNLSKAPLGRFEPDSFSLHRVTTGWGEGASHAEANEGKGIAAQNEDATWLHAVYSSTLPENSVFWATPGGDFAGEASAVADIGYQYGPYTWGPTQQITDDVRSWFYAPDDNHGWLLLGDESELFTARRFDTHENPTPANRPFISVTYALPSSWSYQPLITN